jgi:hypothetical protein
MFCEPRDGKLRTSLLNCELHADWILDEQKKNERKEIPRSVLLSCERFYLIRYSTFIATKQRYPKII